MISTSIEAAFFDSVILSRLGQVARSTASSSKAASIASWSMWISDRRGSKCKRQGGAVADGVVERVPRQVAALVLRRTEPHERVAVALVDRRAGQAEEERVGQGLAHLLPVVALLGAVRLVDHRDDVVAGVEHAGRLAELVDRGDDDLPRALAQQRLQLGARVGRHQSGYVGGVEGAGDLGVEVDAVDDDQDRRVGQLGHRPQLERGEHHEQRLARALEVPDQTLLDLAEQHPLDDQVGRLELLEPGDDLDLAVLLVGGVDREEPQELQHCRRLEDALDRLLDGDQADLRRSVVVGRLLAPRTPQLDRHADRAVAEVLALGGEREHVGHEELRHALLVVVVDLRSTVDPRVRRPNRRLRLTHHQREAVAPQHQVEALLDPSLLEGDLGRDHPLVRRVIVEVIEVDQPDGRVLAVRAERHRLLPGQPRHELLVRHDRMRAGAGGDQDRAEVVDDLVGLVRVGRDLRVQPDQRSLDRRLRASPRRSAAEARCPARTGRRSTSPGRGRSRGPSWPR